MLSTRQNIKECLFTYLIGLGLVFIIGFFIPHWTIFYTLSLALSLAILQIHRFFIEQIEIDSFNNQKEIILCNSTGFPLEVLNEDFCFTTDLKITQIFQNKI